MHYYVFLVMLKYYHRLCDACKIMPIAQQNAKSRSISHVDLPGGLRDVDVCRTYRLGAVHTYAALR